MLGEQPRGYFNATLGTVWTRPEYRAHSGYETDHLRALLSRETPPPELPGNPWRALEILTWLGGQIAKLEAQRDRLSAA
jgi:hypothetical protein